MFSRRQFCAVGSAAAGLGMTGLLPAWARTGVPGPARIDYELAIRRQAVRIAGREAMATTINGTLPGPLLRMREGDEVVLRVRNELDTDSSLHWHGILLPPEMDGVPGISFDGIEPGKTFEYRYVLRQHGTYWYHSHSGFQEQAGVYAPLIVDPSGPYPVAFDRELVIVLSDWTFEDPARVYAKLKKHGEFYNRSQPTLADILRGQSSLASQLDWDRMRMSPSDIADVTGATYTYLLNGHGPDDGWTGQFAPGERVRLRLINASAMTYFNVRIPGLPMTVVQADGQDVAPVEVEELQIAVAETADVIVEPGADRAWGIVAEAMDRSGLAFGTLSPAPGLRAAAPVQRPRPQRSMADMGHGQHSGGSPEAHVHGAAHDAPVEQHGHHGAHQATQTSAVLDRTPGWTPRTGPGVANIVMQPMNRLAEPGTGLADVGHRVLTYADLSAREPFYDDRPPTREITLHLTGNMERYMWSFDGEQASPRTEPIRLAHNERVRLVLINHTMMEHPIHLHGMWMELENGQRPMPRKHTISVKPAERLSVLVTADAPGAWAFHCHLLLHMKAGMMRTVVVAPPNQESRDGKA